MSAPTVDRRQSRPSLPAEPEAPAQVALRTPRSRRALLAGLAGGAGALIANAVSRVSPSRAAAGDPIVLGQNNFAGGKNTQLTTSTSGRAFEVIQNGSGAAIRGKGLAGNGGNFVTAAWNKFAFMAQHDGTGTGSGGAVSARGKLNHGLVASTDAASRTAVSATNTDTTTDNVAVMGLAFNASSADTHPSAAITVYKAAGEFAGVTGVIGASIPGVSAGAGVVGMSPGTSGYGVYGYATSTTGVTNGVYGRTDSTTNDAAGVSGFAAATTGTSSYGVHGATAAPDGTAAGVKGIATGAGANGLWGQCTTSNGYGVYGYGATDGIGVFGYGGYGVYSQGDCHVVGDLTVTGSKAGYVVDLAVNGGSESLHQGDAVKLIGVRRAVVGTIPLLVVAPAGVGDPAIGVVDRRVEVSTSPKRDGANELRASGTSVEPEAHLYVVTLGAFAVASADASAGAIKVGDRLSVGGKGRLGKAVAIQVSGRSIYPAGEQVGYALGGLASGSGTIGVFVNPH